MTDDIGVRHETDNEGLLHVVFDRPGDKVNLLTGDLLRRLDWILEEAAGRGDVRGVLFGSDKPGMFLAGMDVEEIARITDAHEAAEGARTGQAVFDRIAALGKPTVCAISGTCLGGGTELALACTFRLAADDGSVRIGLPEVQIGIVPGFGGTQRLPRLVGLTPSLDLILTGRRMGARRAARIGLVDRVVPAAYLKREARALLRRAVEDLPGTVRSVRRSRPLAARAVETIPPLRRMAISRVRKKTAKKVNPADYPAPFRALPVVEAAFSMPLPQGLDLEARTVGELVPTRTSKNLIWLFKSNNALKRDAGGVRAAPREVRRMAVLGAGIMGGGIAQLAADRGVAVRLRDVRQDAILTALRTAAGLWDGQVRRRRLNRREAAQRMGFIAPTLDLSGMARVDLVVEAVVESLEVKRKVLAELEERMDDRAIFASNTSSLPIREISARARRPERVVGMHFFNPVHRMPLVEVIAGARTSPEAVATVHAFAIRLGKTPVVVRDSPGFLVNRILALYLNEALQLLAEGVPVEAADSALRRFGMPMGPFELLDRVGLDTAFHVTGVLQAAFGPRVGNASAVLEELTGTGLRGAKGGRGFYRYRQGKPTGVNREAYRIAGVKPDREIPPETLQERMILAMVNEAAVCLEEEVVRHPREVDVAMVLGTGFPPFRGGLLRHADDVGVAVVADRLSRLADAHGERFRPAALLREMVRNERKFFPEG